jgi:hypothetical protein
LDGLNSGDHTHKRHDSDGNNAHSQNGAQHLAFDSSEGYSDVFFGCCAYD